MPLLSMVRLPQFILPEVVVTQLSVQLVQMAYLYISILSTIYLASVAECDSHVTEQQFGDGEAVLTA